MEGPHRRHVGIHLPGHLSIPDPSLLGEAPILVMRRMIVASGQLRSHSERGQWLLLAEQRPPDDDQIAIPDHEDFTLDPRYVAGEDPGRPGIRRKLDALFVAGRMNCSRIEIGGERERLAFDVEPFFELVDQQEPLARGCSGGQQERVIPACIRAGHRAGGKSATAVGFEPFEAQGPVQILACCRSDLHASLLTLHPSSPHSPLCWISFATNPVQPVWWLAPIPAPLSPWKYS